MKSCASDYIQRSGLSDVSDQDQTVQIHFDILMFDLPCATAALSDILLDTACIERNLRKLRNVGHQTVQ
eukprot:708525-Amphidinium_carterae.1